LVVPSRWWVQNLIQRPICKKTVFPFFEPFRLRSASELENIANVIPKILFNIKFNMGIKNKRQFLMLLLNPLEKFEKTHMKNLLSMKPQKNWGFWLL
jgi:hypothetical protein